MLNILDNNRCINNVLIIDIHVLIKSQTKLLEIVISFLIRKLVFRLFDFLIKSEKKSLKILEFVKVNHYNKKYIKSRKRLDLDIKITLCVVTEIVPENEISSKTRYS